MGSDGDGCCCYSSRCNWIGSAVDIGGGGGGGGGNGGTKRQSKRNISAVTENGSNGKGQRSTTLCGEWWWVAAADPAPGDSFGRWQMGMMMMTNEANSRYHVEGAISI